MPGRDLEEIDNLIVLELDIIVSRLVIHHQKWFNKNYSLVRNAGFAHFRNIPKLHPIFKKSINEWISEAINEVFLEWLNCC